MILACCLDLQVLNQNVSQVSESSNQIVNITPEYELKVLTLATAEISQYHGHNSKNVIIPSIIDGKNIVGIGKGAFQRVRQSNMDYFIL